MLELQTLSLYILVSFKQTSSLSTEAGLKYFILGSFSSGLLLFGISLVYGFSGLLNFEDMYIFASALSYNTTGTSIKLLSIESGFLLGLLFILVSLLFKLGIAPFHIWLPDVYEGAPTIIMAFMSIIPKIVILFVILKLYLNIFFFFNFIWHYIFIFLSLLSIIWGAIAALYQVKIKRLFTYSMINNSGFFLLGSSFVNIESVHSVFLYLFIYLFPMLGIFVSILSLKEKNNNLIIKKIFLLVNLYNINPLFAITFSLLLFSIGGIPPLIGFYGKFYLFIIALKNSIIFVSILFVIFSIVSLFYYLRLVKLIFFNKNKFWFFFDGINKSSSIMLSVITFINTGFFIYPDLLFRVLHNFSILFYL
jgi:proton-translocating NADH-quinone oxidoreductase chain N